MQSSKSISDCESEYSSEFFDLKDYDNNIDEQLIKTKDDS